MGFFLPDTYLLSSRNSGKLRAKVNLTASWSNYITLWCLLLVTCIIRPNCQKENKYLKNSKQTLKSPKKQPTKPQQLGSVESLTFNSIFYQVHKMTMPAKWCGFEALLDSFAGINRSCIFYIHLNGLVCVGILIHLVEWQI